MDNQSATYIIPYGVVYTNYLNRKRNIEKGDKVIDKSDPSIKRLEVLSVGQNLAKVTHTSSGKEEMIPIERLSHAFYQSYKAPLFVDNCVIKFSQFTRSKLANFYKNLVPPVVQTEEEEQSPRKTRIDKDSKWTNKGYENYENHIRTSILYKHVVELHNRILICSCGDGETCHGNILINLFNQMGQSEKTTKTVDAVGFLDGVDLKEDKKTNRIVNLEAKKKKAPVEAVGFLDGMDLEEDEPVKKAKKKKAPVEAVGFLDGMDLEEDEPVKKAKKKKAPVEAVGFLDGVDLKEDKKTNRIVNLEAKKKKAPVEAVGFLDGMDLEEDEPVKKAKKKKAPVEAVDFFDGMDLEEDEPVKKAKKKKAPVEAVDFFDGMDLEEDEPVKKAKKKKAPVEAAGFLDGMDLEEDEPVKKAKKKKAPVEAAGFLDGIDLEKDEPVKKAKKKKATVDAVTSRLLNSV
jgi:hypothetical protein